MLTHRPRDRARGSEPRDESSSLSGSSILNASVVQWLECRTRNAVMVVRLYPLAPNMTNAEHQRRWRQMHPVEAKEKTKARIALAIAKRRELILSHKKRPCADCSVEYPPYVMDHDHVRGKKCFLLSVAAQKRISIQRIKRELEKCDVVCANCHRKRTELRRSSSVIERLLGKQQTQV